MAGWGKIGRLAAELHRDETNLSAEEKEANKAARINALGEIGNLMKAMKQLEAEKAAGGGGSSLEENPADSVACFLYGALNLDADQFSQVCGLVEKYGQQAKDAEKQNADSPEQKEAAVKGVIDAAMAEIKSALTIDQTKLLDEIMPFIQMGPGKFNFNFSFNN
jgi:hypothetical protein